MYSLIASFLAIALMTCSAGAQKSNTCDANNCYRAAVGTVGGTASGSSRLAVCSSYQSCIVTPATSTITVSTTSTPLTTTTVPVTVTETSTSTLSSTSTMFSYVPAQLKHKRNERGIEKRAVAPAAATTVCPTALPSDQAAKCAATPGAFASACSCVGITRAYATVASPLTQVTSTSTAPTSTITSFSTSTSSTSVTVTSTIVQTVTGSSFHLKVVGSTYDGLFVRQADGQSKLGPVPNDPGFVFSLDAANANTLYTPSDGRYCFTTADYNNAPPIFIGDYFSNPVRVTCSVVTGFLQCTSQGRSTLVACESGVGGWIGPYIGLVATIPTGCTTIALQVTM